MIEKIKIVIVALSLLFISLINSVEAYAQSSTKITKCKDEKGVWHYGSSNLHRCSDSSNITTFNERGVRIDQQEKVKTEQELKEEQVRLEDERRAIEKEKYRQLEKQRILASYQSEDDVQVARDKKILSYDRKITEHENYINALENQEKSLRSKIKNTTNASIKRKSKKKIETIAPKITSSETKIKELKRAKIQENNKFDQDLEFYRQYTR